MCSESNDNSHEITSVSNQHVAKATCCCKILRIATLVYDQCEAISYHGTSLSAHMETMLGRIS